MERFKIAIEVSVFASDIEDAQVVAEFVRAELDFGGQTFVKVASVKPEFSHDQCAALGICLCERK